MHEREPLLFSFKVFPIGSGDDVAGPVARCVELVDDAGLAYQVTGATTVLEGTWDEVMPVLERCFHELTEEHPRVWASIEVDHHGGQSGRIESSVDRIEEILGHAVRR